MLQKMLLLSKVMLLLLDHLCKARFTTFHLLR